MCRERETSHITSFSTLPFEMVEQVLAKLSLIELARISTTCSAFRAVSRTQIPREQEARCKLAVKVCGRERIARIVALIVGLLKGEPFSKDLITEKWNERWISADGVLYGPLPRSSAGSRPQPEHGDIRVLIMPGSQDGSRTVYGSIAVAAGDWASSRIMVKALRDDKGAVTDVFPIWDGDLEVVALMQALLMSVGLVRLVQDEGQKFEIWIRRVSGCSHAPMAPRAVLRAQVAPLVALATRHTHIDNMLGHWSIFETNMFIEGA
jgi:hypothetical protein